MNEHTQKLLQESTYYILGVPLVDQKKFAELIVRECGKSCTLQGDEDDMFRKFGIKHFGVEE